MEVFDFGCVHKRHSRGGIFRVLLDLVSGILWLIAMETRVQWLGILKDNGDWGNLMSRDDHNWSASLWEFQTDLLRLLRNEKGKKDIPWIVVAIVLSYWAALKIKFDLRL